MPTAASPINRIFIVILASADRAATMAWYRERLALEESGSYAIPYTMISRAFGMPPDTLRGLSMAQKGRMPIVEIDDHPAAATVRAGTKDMLPPGNAMVTLAAYRLDDAGWIPSHRRSRAIARWPGICQPPQRDGARTCRRTARTDRDRMKPPRRLGLG